MTMICERVRCVGGSRKEYRLLGKRASRLMPFPDGVSREITMPVNDWAIFDQCFSTRDPFYLSTTKKIVERSEWWAKRWNQTPEMVIKHMFRFAFATGIGRKRVLGIRRYANNNWKM